MDYIVKAYKDWKLHSQFHEIVPDMDDDYIFNEKQSIRESARSLKKYGSCNHMRNYETLIRHEIDKTDTLAGIALRYGCTTEQIRRANRLFASDSLFLRQFLLIPVDKTSPHYPKAPADENDSDQATSEELDAADTTARIAVVTATPDAQAFTDGSDRNSTAAVATTSHVTSSRQSALPTRPYSIAGELLVSLHDDAALNNHSGSGGSASANSAKQSKSLDSVVAMTPDEENRRCMKEFLSKIDSTILESRKYVEKSKEMKSSQSDDDLFGTTDLAQRRRQHNNNNNLNNSYKNNQPNHIRQSSTGSNASDTAQLLSTTQSRRVQNSLKRLEQQQDAFFEL